MAIAVLAGLWYFPVTPSLPPLPQSQDRLFHPDAVIQSRALSQLPKDILAVPLLHTLLTEEYLFYYQQNENRLTLEGTVRRLAYEHDMGVGDEVIAYLLNTPAQVALWKNKDGKLKDYLLVLPKKGVVRLLELLSHVALNDDQLKQQAEIKLDGAVAYTIWRIDHTPRQTLYFATLKDYLLVFTDATLLDISKEENRQEAIRQFVTHIGPNLLGASLRLPELAGQHTLAVLGAYLSFGYQHFFPALEAVRFDFDGAGWKTSIFSTAPFTPAAALWKRLPTDPALCLALPVDRSRLLAYLRQFTDSPALPELLDNVRPPAALCWYGDSQLHTPIAVLPMEKSSESWFPLLAGLFAQTVGIQDGGAAQADPASGAGTPCPGGRVWRRQVRSPHGLPEPTAEATATHTPRSFAVTLVRASGEKIRCQPRRDFLYQTSQT
ncbi:MAG: DUF2138 family protein [Magnetococcales bacterium]|nr:DUF2138 family protein [Magnetococcales bacterium]